MAKNKKLYYEVLPADDPDSGESGADIGEVEVVGAAITPERDRYAELIEAAKNTERVRFRIQPDSAGSRSVATIFLAAIIIAGGALLSFAKSRGAIIAVSVCMLAAIAVGISALIYVTAKAKRVYYCYYEKNERGVFCASAFDDTAVVFAYGRAYRIEGERFYVLDEDAYVKYLDGECCGIVSVLRAERDDVECDDDGYCFVKNGAGGGHGVFVEEGRIVRITSEQPYKTDDVDGKTGEAKVKIKTFVKTDPQYDFSWELPEFVADRLKDNGIDINDLLPQV